jgi:hypothetical protein
MHFEIQASNPPVLMDFYSKLFGWTFNKWEAGEYWMIHTGPDDQPGINGGLLPRQGPPPADMAAVNASVLTIIVDDLDATLAKLGSIGAGAKVAVPKMAVPSIGWLAYIKDPDGNFFGMMQPDIRAA